MQHLMRFYVGNVHLLRYAWLAMALVLAACKQGDDGGGGGNPGGGY